MLDGEFAFSGVDGTFLDKNEIGFPPLIVAIIVKGCLFAGVIVGFHYFIDGECLE